MCKEKFNLLIAKIPSLLQLSKLHIGLFRRIGDDLRKAGALSGIGILGMIVPNDKTSPCQGAILFFLGVLLWAVGHAFIYIADKAELVQTTQAQSTVSTEE